MSTGFRQGLDLETRAVAIAVAVSTAATTAATTTATTTTTVAATITVAIAVIVAIIIPTTTATNQDDKNNDDPKTSTETVIAITHKKHLFTKSQRRSLFVFLLDRPYYEVGVERVQEFWKKNVG